MSSALVIHPDGLIAWHHPVDIRLDGNNLPLMYRLIGCDCVDVARTGPISGEELDLWVSDDGLITGEPWNPMATMLRDLTTPSPYPIAGRALVLSHRGPATAALEDDYAAQLAGLLMRVGLRKTETFPYHAVQERGHWPKDMRFIPRIETVS